MWRELEFGFSSSTKSKDHIWNKINVYTSDFKNVISSNNSITFPIPVNNSFSISRILDHDSTLAIYCKIFKKNKNPS